MSRYITAESTESRDYKARHELNDGLSSFTSLRREKTTPPCETEESLGSPTSPKVVITKGKVALKAKAWSILSPHHCADAHVYQHGKFLHT